MGNGTALNRESIIGDIAGALDIPASDIGDDDNLADLGLDSVRLMSLIERWRSQGAENADFVTLAADPRVGAWAELLTGSAQ